MHRGRLLAAALTIPLAYLAAGEPAVAAARSRFPEWDRFVRRPLLWLGIPDPLDTQSEVRASDPEREAHVSLLHAWQTAFADELTTVARATSAAIELNQRARPDLYEALHAVAGDKGGTINSRRLGRYLKRNARRIEDGMRIEDMGEDSRTHRRQFRVAGVSGVSGVFSNPSREKAGEGEDLYRGRQSNADNANNAVCRRCDGEGCEWCQVAQP